MYPPNIDAQYYGNLSVVKSTTDPAVVHQAITNIQALGAQYLPLIPLSYGSELWGYSTARWTNWTPFPYAWMNWGAQDEMAWYSYLRPVGGSSSTGSSSNTSAVGVSSSTSLPVSTSSSSIQAVSSSTNSIIATSSGITTTSAGASTTLIAVIVVVAVIVLVAVGLLVMRRRAP
jgi:hypothetical protein